MANTLTALAPTLYSALQEVSNEPFGALDAITMTFDDKRVAKGDTVKVPIAPTRTAADFTPGATAPEGDAATADAVGVTISKSRKVSWHLTGEQKRSLENAQSDREWVRQLIAQGARTLRNEAEADACVAIKSGASRATGTAGTTPFASTLGDLTAVRKILADNGAPMADLQCVIDTSAGLKLRDLGIIQQAYQAGSDEERRSGNLLRQFGFQIRESAGIALHTKGTGASYVFDGAHAAKARTLKAKTGTGTIMPGDILAFQGDTNKYVANVGLAAAGDFVIGRPGLRSAKSDGNTITVGNDYTPNLAFERGAVAGVARPPVFDPNPTIKQMTISDKSGLTFLLLEISQYGQTTWELHLAWGFQVVQPEHVALILG